MSITLRPAYYVPAAVLLVFVSAVLTLLVASSLSPQTHERVLGWITGISSAGITAAGISAVAAILGYVLNRQAAIRSATIEAQKMLLEINKLYVACPKLLKIEGEYDGDVSGDVDFQAKLRAMAYLKLNVFEVVFAVLPVGAPRRTWTEYFKASLSRSDLLSKELEDNRAIYHTALIDAYDAWKARRR